MDIYTNPTEVATELGIEPAKVLGWIRSGELVAINIAQRATGKPRWRIRRDDLETFLAGRQSRPKATPRTRKRQSGVIEFYK